MALTSLLLMAAIDAAFCLAGFPIGIYGTSSGSNPLAGFYAFFLIIGCPIVSTIIVEKRVASTRRKWLDATGLSNEEKHDVCHSMQDGFERAVSDLILSGCLAVMFASLPQIDAFGAGMSLILIGIWVLFRHRLAGKRALPMPDSFE